MCGAAALGRGAVQFRLRARSAGGLVSAWSETVEVTLGASEVPVHAAAPVLQGGAACGTLQVRWEEYKV